MARLTKSARIKPVVWVAETREKTAARELGECQRVLKMREDRLTDLKGYQREYAHRLRQTGEHGIESSQLLGFNTFLNDLSRAIEQQQELVLKAKDDLEEKRKHWFKRRGNLKAIENVADRYRDQENKRDQLREQSDMDERAQRIVSNAVLRK